MMNLKRTFLSAFALTLMASMALPALAEGKRAENSDLNGKPYGQSKKVTREDELLENVLNLIVDAIRQSNKKPTVITYSDGTTFNVATASKSGALASEERELLGRAADIVGTVADDDLGYQAGRMLRRSAGVLIVPFADEPGSRGVVFARDGRGNWSGPAFVTLERGSSGVLSGMGWIIPLNDQAMLALRRQTREAQTPATERQKMLSDQEGYGTYRDKVYDKDVIENLVLRPDAGANRRWWGAELYLTEALNERAGDKALGVVKSLSSLERRYRDW